MSEKIRASTRYLCPTCDGTGTEQIGDFYWEECEDCLGSGEVRLSEKRLETRCQILARTSCSYPRITRAYNLSDSNIFQDIEEKSVIQNLGKDDRRYYLECGNLKNFYHKCGLKPKKTHNGTIYTRYPPK